ncbi:GGDEF domain-containing protein [Pseudooceanicola aestuarii]|uniref:GGDEF domain-containing protein n=1 Tax=Pseudooceanicola aestuarii TaxID=2697319 RepID=UPI001EF856D4|nr:GGDEF domain-containing protein [Pseudooceanicola aestuarii]
MKAADTGAWGLPNAALDRLMPMHVIVDAAGLIRHSGPTSQKIFDNPLIGRRFDQVFSILRPRAVRTGMVPLEACARTLYLHPSASPHTPLKGIVTPITTPVGAVLVNLSFGFTILDAVRDFSLNSTDFAATELTIEVLYLVEAKSAAMSASRRLNRQLQGAKLAAEVQAYTDTLTGLKNRRAMDQVLDRLVRTRRAFSLAHLDLDFFKAVNDAHGHAAGDAVLQRVARIMVEETRQEDLVARIGGDEFVLIFEGLTARARLAQIAQRLIDRISEPIQYEGQSCKIAASIGLSRSIDFAKVEPVKVLAAADKALYSAKRNGRACYSIF